ncbi:hypothetical protein V2J09_006331, partial [Rumex salicifolius]
EDLYWHQAIYEYLPHGVLPNDTKKKVDVKRRALRFIIENDILYHRSFDRALLRCLSKEEAQHTLSRTHYGICGVHQVGPKLVDQVKTLGYYWPTMVEYAMEFAKSCHACQFHSGFIHQSPILLHRTTLSWPFNTWGLDVVGSISPISSCDHQYIFVATDYFSKWTKAIPLKGVGAKDFLAKKFGFKHSFSSSYNLSLNGQAEAFNKILCKILKNVLEALDEKRLAAKQTLKMYQAQVAGVFNKRVKFLSFVVGDLVLTIR